MLKTGTLSALGTLRMHIASTILENVDEKRILSKTSIRRVACQEVGSLFAKGIRSWGRRL
jgi:hypothetical protein